MNAQNKTRELIEAGQREVVLDDQRLEQNRARVLARVAAIGVVAAGVSASSSVGAASSAAASKAALGAAAASKAAASFSVAKLVVAVVVVGGSVTGTYALTTRTEAEPQPQQSAQAARAPVPQAVPAPAATEVDTESNLAPPESALPDAAKSVPAPQAGASKPQTSAKNLSEHADLLRDARAALSAGDAARALTLLDGHREVARGPLGQEWAAARILVLCRLGRVAEAKQSGARFLKSHASSPLAAQVAASCAAP